MTAFTVSETDALCLDRKIAEAQVSRRIAHANLCAAPVLDYFVNPDLYQHLHDEIEHWDAEIALLLAEKHRFATSCEIASRLLTGEAKEHEAEVLDCRYAGAP